MNQENAQISAIPCLIHSRVAIGHGFVLAFTEGIQSE